MNRKIDAWAVQEIEGEWDCESMQPSKLLCEDWYTSSDIESGSVVAKPIHIVDASPDSDEVVVPKKWIEAFKKIMIECIEQNVAPHRLQILILMKELEASDE